MRNATGDRDGGVATLAAARALLELLGAQAALRRAEALARGLAGATATSARPTALPGGLSAREADVLRLAARGLTSAQIADRLFLSRRTVEQHLRAVYNKLGVENRAAAVAFAVEHGLR